MNRILVKTIIVCSLFGVVQSSSAKDWFGKNNRMGSFGGFGGNGGCNDWPEWTPMYWMEEMSGGNDDCRPQGSYGGQYRNPYQYHQQVSPYAYPYGASAYGAGAYGANPYLANAYAARVQQYRANPYATTAVRLPSNRRPQAANSWANTFGGRGLTGLTGNGFSNPFSSLSGGSSPFSSLGMGSSSPWSSFGSPMGYGGFPGMSPMGGFGSPISPMSMGMMPGGGIMPGANPFGGFGSSSFSPFK